MELIYALEDTPEILHQSIFLAGPTPRSEVVASWRPEMIEQLERAGFDGTVFVPEPRGGGCRTSYLDQVAWEKRLLDLCDAILTWVPREQEHLPGFTTNVEFGRYVTSRRLSYGRPPGAPHTAYLDWLYESECRLQPSASMTELAEAVVGALKGREAERRGAERFVPIQIWETEMFQNWYASHRRCGNRLDDARVLWTFYPKPGFLLSFMLHVNLWVEAEQRHKSNEFIFSRRDIATVLPIWRAPAGEPVLNSKVVLVREFRSTVRNPDSFVCELPGGCSVKEIGDGVLEAAAQELREETGLAVAPERLIPLGDRQLCATASTHKSYLFLLQLTDEELRQAEATARNEEMHGDQSETEQTYVEVRTVRELLASKEADFSTLGMVMEGLLGQT